jgi:hypothetical protein
MQELKGVQFVTDSSGQKVGVLIDLHEWGDLWEDIYDSMIAKERTGEPRMKLTNFEEELRAEGLLSE